eukprot:s92_g18.t1
MAADPAQVGSLEEVRTIEGGPSFPYVLKIPVLELEEIVVPAIETIAIPVIARKEGILLALPLDALPEAIQNRSFIQPDELIGPCHAILVPAVVEMEDGTERSTGTEVEVLLVDFHMSVLPFLRGYDPVTDGEGILFFSEGDADVLPSSQGLHDSAAIWLDQAQEDRALFYSAAEEEKPLPKAPAKAKAKAGPKKVTTAALSEQLASLAQTLPAISSQLQELQNRQLHFEALLNSGPAVPKLPSHRQNFDVPKRGMATPSPARYLQQLGQPPRVKPAASVQAQAPMPEDEPTAPLEEQEPDLNNPAIDIAASLLQQQKAITSLVAHLASQDGLHDLAGGSSSSSSISLKGSARREKMLADLSSRKGEFLLKVTQNAFKRLKPGEAVPRTLQEFGGKAVFTKYMERQGGYGGQQRDLGLIQWLLAHIADQMVAGDMEGAKELMGLTIVALEQAAGLFAPVPPGLGGNYFVLCEGGGHHQFQAPGVSPFKEAMGRKDRRQGGGQQEEERGRQACPKAKGRRERRRSMRVWQYEPKERTDPKQDVPAAAGVCRVAEDVFNSGGVHKEDSLGQPAAVEDSTDFWTSLQSFSFARWTSTLCRRVMASRTPFSEFLRTTFHVDRSSSVMPEQALFPLPVPKVRVFRGRFNEGSRQRRRRAFDQAFHIAVMALNFWHADCRFVPLSELSKIPSLAQRSVLENLRRRFKAFGSMQGNFSVPASGRRSTNLIAQLADLSEFLNWQCPGGGSYSFAFRGDPDAFEEIAISNDKSRAEELVPYRALCPSRLKITGTGSWDPSPFLSDALWLAYQEPLVLQWREEPSADVPDLSREVYADVLGLAKLWDTKGLLHLFDLEPSQVEPRHCMRFFNCYKSPEQDRMIGDRRARNSIEGIIPGASRALPPATLLTALEIDPRCERFSLCVSDRKDFYHQFKVTSQRARSNLCFPPLAVEDLRDTAAYQTFLAGTGRQRYERGKHGDDLAGLGQKRRKKLKGQPEQFWIGFGAVPQGDHLGVEFAVDSHRSLLKAHDLLQDQFELRADRAYRGDGRVCGLVIDDFYSISKVPSLLCPEASEELGSTLRRDKPEPVPWALSQLNSASEVYQSQGLLGSPEKDVVDECKAKITGAEIDSSLEVRRLGLCTLGTPVQKRLAMALVSLELARLRFTSDSLHLCLLGGWVNAMLFRRPVMSLFSEAFLLADAQKVEQDAPKVIPLPRKVAQEFVLASVLCPFFATDLSATFPEEIYATDSSDRKGAVVCAEVGEEVTRALWRTSRKKGGYVRMLSREEALIKKMDHMYQPDSAGDQTVEIPRPLALRYHFIEVCGGAGKISKILSDRGWIAGPVLDLERSEHFNLENLRVLNWIYHLLEEGLLDSCMLEPPCTTFSPAQHPALRSYNEPRGFDPTEPRTLQGTTLALRSLAVMKKGVQVRAPCLLEQPRRTKMRRLAEWIYFLENLLAEEVWTASCMFGSIHLKEFVFLCACMDATPLHRRCSRDHVHVKIEGKYTKPSATYVDALAEAIAKVFHSALLEKMMREEREEPTVSGLENPLCNDFLRSASWRVKKVWTWRKPRHINIHETTAVHKLLKDLAICKANSRPFIALDSHVALSSLVKGRSPSRGLQPTLRQIGATVIAGNLYPGYQFAPTRLNPADHPTRDNPMPEPSASCISKLWTFLELVDLGEIDAVSRPAANWIHLFLRLHGSPLWWKDQKESWRCLLFLSIVAVVSAVPGASHGTELGPRDRGDTARAAMRGSLELPEGRPVLGKTQAQRDKLFAAFGEWLKQDGFSLDSILLSGSPDIELLNQELEKYGRSLYRAGRPYNHYAETINAISSKRPRVRRSLQGAWDLAYAWLRSEPPNHHIALPWQVMLALVSTALAWGWIREAGIIALSWGGLTRIGEAMTALRSQLILPRDVEFSAGYILLQIAEPKTRFRAARHQVAKLDQPQLVTLVDVAFGHLQKHQKLWCFSGQTMRTRFQKLLEANHLDSLPKGLARGLDLGSLRAGGASWLLMQSEDSELTRRRGRWINSKVMETYVQEATSLQFLPGLPGPTKQLIIAGAQLFPWLLSCVVGLRAAQIPESVWCILIKSEAVEHEQNGGAETEEVGGISHTCGHGGLVDNPFDMAGEKGRSSSEMLDINIDQRMHHAQAARPRALGPSLAHF